MSCTALSAVWGRSLAVGGIYPVLLDAVGHCPPEDCDGPWGYMEALEILADPKHEGYKELSEWWPDFFLTPEDLTRRVSNLARPRAKKPRAKAR